MSVIRINPNHILPRRGRKALIHGKNVSFVFPAVDDFEAGIGVSVEDFDGIVRRSVIDGNDLNLIAALLGKNAIQTVAEVATVVVARNDETDEGRSQGKKRKRKGVLGLQGFDVKTLEGAGGIVQAKFGDATLPRATLTNDTRIKSPGGSTQKHSESNSRA